jgi:hypothetical protein
MPLYSKYFCPISFSIEDHETIDLSSILILTDFTKWSKDIRESFGNLKIYTVLNRGTESD